MELNLNRVQDAKFNLGEKVWKAKGDYTFRGEVVGVILKLSGSIRYVVENSDGILHIFSENQLEKQ